MNITYIDCRDIVDTPQGTGRLAYHNGKVAIVEINGEKIKFNPSEITNRRPC